VRLLAASVIVQLLPYCAPLCFEKRNVTVSYDYDEDDDIDNHNWKDDIAALFDNEQHMEVSESCLNYFYHVKIYICSSAIFAVYILH